MFIWINLGHIKRHLTAPFQSISIFKLGVKNGKTPGRHVQAGWQKTFDWAWLVKIGVKQLLNDDKVHVAFMGAKVAVCFDLQFFTTSQRHL
jgi:hypothetical protein